LEGAVVEIGLADAVAGMRDELLAAVGRGVDPRMPLVVGPIELEFVVELREDTKVQGGFKAWVVSASGTAGSGRSDTHRVKITITPRAPGGGDVMVGASVGHTSESVTGQVASGFIGR
jgi:hypothetical protein